MESWQVCIHSDYVFLCDSTARSVAIKEQQTLSWNLTRDKGALYGKYEELAIVLGLEECKSQLQIYPVSWGCRIHQLHLYKGVELPQQVFWIWYKTIWWWGFRDARVLGNVVYLFIAIASDRVLSMDPIELNCVIMLDWIVCN